MCGSRRIGITPILLLMQGQKEHHWPLGYKHGTFSMIQRKKYQAQVQNPSLNASPNESQGSKVPIPSTKAPPTDFIKKGRIDQEDVVLKR